MIVHLVNKIVIITNKITTLSVKCSIYLKLSLSLNELALEDSLFSFKCASEDAGFRSVRFRK